MAMTLMLGSRRGGGFLETDQLGSDAIEVVASFLLGGRQRIDLTNAVADAASVTVL